MCIQHYVKTDKIQELIQDTLQWMWDEKGVREVTEVQAVGFKEEIQDLFPYSTNSCPTSVDLHFYGKDGYAHHVKTSLVKTTFKIWRRQMYDHQQPHIIFRTDTGNSFVAKFEEKSKKFEDIHNSPDLKNL